MRGGLPLAEVAGAGGLAIIGAGGGGAAGVAAGGGVTAGATAVAVGGGAVGGSSEPSTHAIPVSEKKMAPTAGSHIGVRGSASGSGGWACAGSDMKGAD
jgi:hypothetical protein